MACKCCSSDGHVTYIRSPIPRSMVSVAYGRSTAQVRIAALRVRRESGRRLVSLADVWSAASCASDLDELRFDFVGDDGFDTSRKEGRPLRGRLLHEGFVDLATRDLVWSVDLPCYYRVKGLVTVVARAFVPTLVDGAE